MPVYAYQIGNNTTTFFFAMLGAAIAMDIAVTGWYPSCYAGSGNSYRANCWGVHMQPPPYWGTMTGWASIPEAVPASRCWKVAFRPYGGTCYAPYKARSVKQALDI